MGFRISDYVFGAVNKLYFMGRDKLKNERMKEVTKYVNVHVITVNKDSMMAKCTCGHKEKTGRPCLHLLLIVDNFYPEMFNVRWSKVYNSDLYNKSQSINDSCIELRREQDRCFGWTYIGNGWNCAENVSLFNGMTDLQQSICMVILKMHKDSVPCYFGSKGPIIPPGYSHTGLLSSNTIDHSEFCADFQFGAADTDELDVFVSAHPPLTESSQQKYSKIESCMKTTWKWVQGTGKYEDEFLKKMKLLEDEFAVKISGNIKVAYKPGQLISSCETHEHRRMAYKRLKPAGEKAQSPKRKRKSKVKNTHDDMDNVPLGEYL